MFGARELQRACPRYQTWLLQVFDSGVPVTATGKRSGLLRSFSTAAPRTFRCSPRQQPEKQLRKFSSTGCHRNGPSARSEGENDVASSTEDLEAVVRQARATFGDTLPPNYLTGQEYKLYERLYGAPLRATRPEDVGIAAGKDDVASGTGHTLVMEADGGLLLEGAGYRVESQGAAAEAELSGAEDTTEFSSLEDAGVDVAYANAMVRDQREFEALSKLQRDFEAAIETQKVRDEGEEDGEEQEEEEEDEEEEEEEEGDDTGELILGPRGASSRLHPLTAVNHARTYPSTVYLPKADFIQPVTDLLRRTDTKHIQQAAEKLFGGPGLPLSPVSPRRKRPNMSQKAIPLEAGQHRMSEIDADTYLATVMPAVYSSTMHALVEVRRRLGSEWMEELLSRRERGGGSVRVLDVGGGGAALAAWNTVMRAQVAAMRGRAGVTSDAAEGGQVDAVAEAPTTESEGSGEAKTETSEEDAKDKRGKMEKVVVVGSPSLRYRISRFLHNTTFLPRLPDLLHSAANAERHLDGPVEAKPRKLYDVILASHLLLPLTKSYERRDLLENLWKQLKPNGGVLVLLEKGHPRGFEAVADARQQLLKKRELAEKVDEEKEKEEKEEDEKSEGTKAGMKRAKKTLDMDAGTVIAPCTNQDKCPMYLIPGLSAGRKDYCHFRQRFIRPPFLQKIVGQTHRNHEDVEFSYVAVQKGGETAVAPATQADRLARGRAAADEAFAGYEHVTNTESEAVGELPRLVLAPLKRNGHVILDVCTPAGQLERWMVPRSLSRQAYHDARKAQWGDLWALGAKTRMPRNLRLGRNSGREESESGDDGQESAGSGPQLKNRSQAKKERKRKKQEKREAEE